MNRIRTFFIHLAACAAVLGGTLAPALTQAQSLKDLDRLVQRRQDKKNEWRNIAIASGALGIIGLLRKDQTLFFAGTAGALYSAHRYEQDRKSQSKLQRARAAYFNRGSFVRDGQRYVRRSTYKNGKKYYYFAKAR